jgi:prefoldin subunit 5|tara:strand:+ start:3978 stop:4199 length:222 start_codon:yes stop_codon:yes gene_type:complete
MNEEVEWLEHQIEALTERCDKLEKENFELKRCINVAINNLEKQNSDAKKHLKGVEVKDNVYKPNFKKPQWDNK